MKAQLTGQKTGHFHLTNVNVIFFFFFVCIYTQKLLFTNIFVLINIYIYIYHLRYSSQTIIQLEYFSLKFDR